MAGKLKNQPLRRSHGDGLSSRSSRRTSSASPWLTFWRCAVSVGSSSSARPARTWSGSAMPTRTTTAKPYGICDPLRKRASWRARPTTRRSVLSPPNNRTVRAVRCVCGVRSLRTLRTRRTPTTAATRNSSISVKTSQSSWRKTKLHSAFGD